ncbi:hypothetical protein JYU34_004885 [Plutella xylostella]|uniref:Uncharacterized protein n=1 Tax=Plutella xylostella TaxID=51655 RepID=A0ABQ7QVF7_PLUXY|nr:hypothetical protein JYU34_004885 [Plutella xylostella]
MALEFRSSFFATEPQTGKGMTGKQPGSEGGWGRGLWELEAVIKAAPQPRLQTRPPRSSTQPPCYRPA